MELSVFNIKGEDTGRKVTLNDAIFGIEPNDHAIYLDVKQYLANQRQGTHKSKERSEVSGSTRKLIRQKGGGGARRGDINSPVLVGVALSAYSGILREKEQNVGSSKVNNSQKSSLVKGLVIVVSSGILSSLLNVGFEAAIPIIDNAKSLGATYSASSIPARLSGVFSYT